MRTDELLVVCLGADADPTEALLHATTYRALTVNGIPEARKALTDGSYLLGLLLMGDVPGCTLEAIDALLEQWQSMQWVGVFAPQAVQRDGVRHLILQHLCDFHTWPLDAAVLGYSLRRARAFVDLGKNNIPQQAAEKGQGGSDGMAIVGNSPAVVELRRHIKKVSHVNAPVLIWGESGSGKELVALAIHQHSRRAAKPFVAMNCGAVSASLIQSELFGYARGAFTGAVKDKRGLIESAEGGTLFLDEVGDLALDLQVNLLRFLQERTIMRVGSSQPIAVDVRVIAASHGRLDGAVRAGHFREDLLYRLNVLPVSVPALRE
jgi:DNA-binding NtrC family response regulator